MIKNNFLYGEKSDNSGIKIMINTIVEKKKLEFLSYLLFINDILLQDKIT